MTEKIDIVQLGAEVLRLKAQPVDDFAGPEFRQLVELMQSAMLDSNGIGIAAPQLGISKQVVIVASRPTARYPKAPEMAPIVMVNPVYQVVDPTLEKDWEGCLSVPGVRALVPRYRSVRVDYQNPEAEACQLLLEGFPARVFQHEYDHLLGLVYLDRVETNRDIVSESEFFKLIAA